MRATRNLLLPLLLCGALLSLPAGLSAQVGATTDIITGTVIGPDGKPLLGARVEVQSIETEITKTKTTNDKGQYVVLFPDGGGAYKVTVKYLGMAPETFVLSKKADEDRLVAPDARMVAGAARLGTVTVTGGRAPTQNAPPSPGSLERVMSGDQLMRLPIDPTDPNALAALAPGVVSITGNDTTSAGFSVAGQRPDQNQVTLDGLTFSGGAGAVPAEAVRNVRVITNTYDISQGQFTGGRINTTTRGGTNVVSGSFGYAVNAPSLEWTDNGDTASNAFTQGYWRNQLSGGLGGYFVKDKAFWFISGQVSRQDNPLQDILSADALTLQRLGAQPDSAAKFLGLLNSYGVPLTFNSVPNDRLNDRGSGITRLDFHLGEDHTLTFRGNWNGSLSDNYRVGQLSVPSNGGDQHQGSWGVMASLSSTLWDQFLNEFRGTYNRSNNAAYPYFVAPDGSVRISSDLSNGSVAVTNLGFGGNPGLPINAVNDMFEASDEISWLQSGGHRWKLGGLVNLTDFSQINSQNANGTFIYNSLSDFENNTPSTYTRLFEPAAKSGGALNEAIYLGDSWRKSAALQFTYGVRFEGTQYRGAPADNLDVDTLFSHKTSDFPSEVHISPRFGFTYIINNQPQQQGGRGGPGGQGGGGFPGGRGGGFGGAMAPANSWGIIRGGIGEFRGRAPSPLFSSAIDATGLASGELQLTCIGSAVPTPDWVAFENNTGAIPTACSNGQQSAYNATKPNVTVFDPDFETPRSWRGSLGYSKRLSLRYNFSVDGIYALGTSLYGVRDLNLNTTPAFYLKDENNRPVFASPSAIVPSTGAVSILGSRVDPNYTSVYDVYSSLQSKTAQLIFGFQGATFSNVIWNVSYTWTQSADQCSTTAATAGSAFGGCTTSGNPNVNSWATSDLQRRHTVVGSTTWLAKSWLDITSILNVSSGIPYSPMVGSDINGDGSRNDRAFIYDPATVTWDTTLQNGMKRLLSSADPNAKHCLLAQLGQIAGRNTCTTGWFTNLNLQANLRPNLGGSVQQRLQLQVQVVNPLTEMDMLIHGPGNLQGWGQQPFRNSTLLYVRGFDPVSGRYLYTVNERFGTPLAAQTAFFNPFMLALTARYQVGPDRQREMLLNFMRGLGGGGNGNAPIDVHAILERVAPNPAITLLGLNDSLKLHLTKVEIDSVIKIANTMELKDSLVGVDVKQRLDKANGDLASIFPQLQPMLQQVRGNYLDAIKGIQSVLTKEQWDALPNWFKNPSMQGGFRGGPGGGGQRRPPGGP